MRVAGFNPILDATAALIVWAVHFGVIYVAHAIACGRGLAGASLSGLPAVPLIVLGATALALAAVAVIGWRAWSRLGNGLAGQEGEDRRAFLAWFSMSVAMLAALAIAWEGLPVLLVRSCL